jgi:PAS domain S-box-containing protein
MVAGVPAALFRGGVNTQPTHCNPAWINLAGPIAGLNFGHGYVEFVWPSDQDRRPAPAAVPLATQDNRRRPHQAGYEWIDVTASIDQHLYDLRNGREDSQIPLADVKRFDDVLGEGEEPVLKNAERHALAVQGAEIGIWDWDIERGTLYWSPLLKSMVGMTPEDEPVPGITFKSLLHPDDQERAEEVLQRHLVERQPYDTVCRLRRSDGSYRWIRVKAQATWNADEQPTRLAGCIYDITDQKRAEEELRAARDAAETASRAKSLFLATISQELRTPLNTILGMGEILKDSVISPPSARCQENTAVIHRSGQHLLGLIDNILEMARLEAEQVEFHEETVALAAVLDEAIQSVRLSQREARHRLTLDLPSPLPVLSADRRCLKQVLINVLSEAVKSTPKDGRVSVKVSRRGAALDIAIEDSGPGDCGDAAPNVLHPLFRLENVMAQHHQGTALGLFISKVLVERHGGIFQVESNPGGGRVVYISLPAERLPTGMVRQVNGTKVWRHLARNVI